MKDGFVFRTARGGMRVVDEITPITVGIDMERAYYKAPGLFMVFAKVARQCGHRTVFVTKQAAEKANKELLQTSKKVTIVFANGADKRAAAVAAGHHVDVWIG